MRRLMMLAVVGALALGVAPNALAAAPYREHVTNTSASDFAAGVVCDFAYRQTSVTKENYFEFGDLAADGYTLWKIQARTVHTNLDTGYTLTETTSSVQKFWVGTAVQKMVGVYWHLRDADGRLVLVRAGQFVIDYSGADPVEVKVTPKMGNEPFAELICPVLGGNPA